MINCCKITKKNKKCIRKKDKKIFSLPRKFSIKKCIQQPIKGYTMKKFLCAFYLLQKIYT